MSLSPTENCHILFFVLKICLVDFYFINNFSIYGWILSNCQLICIFLLQEGVRHVALAVTSDTSSGLAEMSEDTLDTVRLDLMHFSFFHLIHLLLTHWFTYIHYRCLHRTQRPGLTIRQQSGTPGKRLVTSLLGQILNSFTEATPTYLDYNAPIFETRLHVLQNNCLNYNQSLTTTLI